MPAPEAAGSCGSTASALATSAGQPFPPCLRLEIEHNRPLAPVQRHEVPAEPRRDRHHLPVRITRRRLDLDHLGPELGEQHTAERAGDVLRNLDYANAFEGHLHRRPSPRRAITSCCTSDVPPAIVDPTDAR